MRIHYLQHVAYEDMGYIAQWAQARGLSVKSTALFQGQPLPQIDDIDWLIVMGGPMNIYETERYPWLVPEKHLIAAAVAQRKRVLGICLGAQLIADVLGARTVKNEMPEICWFPVRRLPAVTPAFQDFPERCTVFHWHGDRFDMPAGAVKIAESEGCANQAFSYDDDRVIGIQFHLELEEDGIERLITNCGKTCGSGPFVQPPEEMRAKETMIRTCHTLLCPVLDKMMSGKEKA